MRGLFFETPLSFFEKNMKKKEYKKRRYTIESYNPEYKKRFESEREFFCPIFSEKAVFIEHIGSTAVPGLAGKPIIDMLIAVKKIEIADVLLETIENIGYKSLGDYINKGSRLFVKEVDGVRLMNVHIFEIKHPHVKEMLGLRDYFRSHPSVVEEYSRLKFDLVDKYPDEYDLYRKHKDEWITKLIKSIERETPELS